MIRYKRDVSNINRDITKISDPKFPYVLQKEEIPRRNQTLVTLSYIHLLGYIKL